MRTLHIPLVLVVVAFGCAIHSPPEVSRQTQDVGIFFERYAKSDGYRNAEFSITNASAHPIWFAGYSSQSPLYKIQYFKDGQWEDSPLGWCGTGVELRELHAGSSVRFTVFIVRDSSKPKTMRVGVRCWPEKDYTKTVAKDCWSDKVDVNR